MATTTQYARQESLPPEYLQQFFAGVPGANVPGIMPLMNQDLVNKLQSMGQEGGSPFNYTDPRIAGFSGAEQQGFQDAAEGIGSYQPFFRRGEQLAEQGVSDVRRASDIGTQYMQQAGQEGAGAVREAAGMLRGLPSQFQTAQGLAQGATGQYNPNSAQSFYNPFENQVVDQTLQDINRQYGQASVQDRANQVASGAYGGSRGRLNQEEIARQFGRGATEAIGGIRAGGYSQAQQQGQQAFEQDKSRQLQNAQLYGNLAGQQGNVAGGLGALGTGLSNIYGGVGRDIATAGLGLGQFGSNVGGQLAGFGQGMSGLQNQDTQTLLGIGGMQRGRDQANLDMNYQNFVGQYNLPSQLFGQMGQTAAGFAPALGGTNLTQSSTSAPSNSLMQGIGTAAALYGATRPTGTG